MNNMLSVLIGWALVPVIWAVVIWGFRDIIAMLKEHFGLTSSARGFELSLVRGVIFSRRLIATAVRHAVPSCRLVQNQRLSVTETTR